MARPSQSHSYIMSRSSSTNSYEDKYGYILNKAAGTTEDYERLDVLHEAFSKYFGGRLSMAPLEDGFAPKTILDIG
ncbi:hypothetical protein M422DRAFT_273564 [Sphaerobolus stellatus SS14]|uniref:Uncharacterized protein n=1 Tax=Sphaerobolus stellatus (strain SS14) TaxID=990650 RepID=A0A0C9T8V9_SPHS4|nr:hypothetical protein M422DRAFT_273564 [Sphaerobolus stellatus SS14]